MATTTDETKARKAKWARENYHARLKNDEQYKERARNKARKWYEDNKERGRLQRRKYYEENIELFRERTKEYQKNLPGHVVAGRLGIPLKDCPDELIEAKRIQLKIVRFIKENCNGNN